MKQLVDPEVVRSAAPDVGGMSEEDIAWERLRLRMGLGLEVPREKRWMYFAGERRVPQGVQGSHLGVRLWLILAATGAVMGALGWMLSMGSRGAAAESRVSSSVMDDAGGGR